MELLATLLLAHLIADFPLQTNRVYRLKSRHWGGLLLHSTIHALVTAVLLHHPLGSWPMLAALGGIHFITDWFKLRIKFKQHSLGFVLDQGAHGLALLLLAAWPAQVAGTLPTTYLYPALAYATLPALLMFASILSHDLKESAIPFAHWPCQKAPQIILFSHLVGYPLVVAVMILRLGVWL